MSNTLVTVRWTLDIPEDKLAELVGRPDDDTDEWWQESGEKAAEYVRDNIMDALERYGQAYEPDVECDC